MTPIPFHSLFHSISKSFQKDENFFSRASLFYGYCYIDTFRLNKKIDDFFLSLQDFEVYHTKNSYIVVLIALDCFLNNKKRKKFAEKNMFIV